MSDLLSEVLGVLGSFGDVGIIWYPLGLRQRCPYDVCRASAYQLGLRQLMSDDVGVVGCWAFLSECVWASLAR